MKCIEPFDKIIHRLDLRGGKRSSFRLVGTNDDPLKYSLVVITHVNIF